MSRIVVTGAAGFLGRRLVEHLQDRHQVLAIDRRVPAGADGGDGVRWHQIELSDPAAVARTFDGIRRDGGADVVFHLAAYYDFTGEDHPDYRRTNVDATRLVLEQCRHLAPSRFVFTSSVAACRFSAGGPPVDESTPPLGEHLYAVSKRRGEELLKGVAGAFPVCVVRIAALFSDWCEYPPLYVFLETWRSRRWNARLLGGRGRSAIPYLHVRDGVAFMSRLLERMVDLPDGQVLLASPDGAVSHRQLFEAATRDQRRRPVRPLGVPRLLCRPGMALRDALGRLTGERPFERPWMAAYIDRQIRVDAGRTRALLGWQPSPRRDVLSRVAFMIENMKTDPVLWYARNREALEHHTVPAGFRIYRLLERRQAVVEKAFRDLLAGPGAAGRLERYRSLPPDELDWALEMALGSLLQAVRAGMKAPFMDYCRSLARRRIAQGFAAEEVVAGLKGLEQACLQALAGEPEAAGLEEEIRDHLSMTVEFGVDQLLMAYEDHSSGRLG